MADRIHDELTATEPLVEPIHAAGGEVSATCLACGKENAVRALFCDACGTTLSPHPVIQPEPPEQWTAKSEPQSRPWGISDVIAVGLGGLLLCLIPISIDLLLSSGVLHSLLRDGALTQFEVTAGWILRSVVIQNVVLVGVCFFWLWTVRHQGLSALGLHGTAWRRRVWQGFMAGIGLCILGEIIPRITHQALLLIGISSGDLQLLDAQSPQAQLVQVILKSSPLMKVLAVVVIAGVAPIGEEILFRGFAYQGIKHRLGSRWGAVLTSLAFAALHSNIPAFVAYFILGLLLVWLFERTRSLTAPIVAHSFNNLATVLYILLWAQ